MSGSMRRINRKMALFALLPWLNACALTDVMQGSAVTVAPTSVTSPDYASIEVPDRQAFMGQGPDFLTDLFGPPSLRRKETGAELWQYAGPTCIVLFYLYEDDGGLTIDHFDARARQATAEAIDETLCIKEVAALKDAASIS